jgi:hypothetical protein
VPRKSEWLERLPAILTQIRALPAPVVDRATVEGLFGVRRREAIRLLHRFGGFQAGKTFLISRDELLRQLDNLEATDDFRAESKRRRRLADDLATMREDVTARRVPIAASHQTTSGSIKQLGPNVRLKPDRLEIEFKSPEELLTRLFELARTIASDFEGFTKLLEVPQ